MINKESAEKYSWGEECMGWHLTKEKSLSIIQETMPPGSREKTHMHSIAEQFFFILKGTATFTSNKIVEVLHAQDGIHVSPGTIHQIVNNDSEELEFLVISTPPSQGDRIDIP